MTRSQVIASLTLIFVRSGIAYSLMWTGESDLVGTWFTYIVFLPVTTYAIAVESIDGTIRVYDPVISLTIKITAIGAFPTPPKKLIIPTIT